MSDAEYECLIAGGRLMNATHHGESGYRTNSIGFCFFIEEPDEAIHWLAGCTYPDWCVTMEVPEHLLKESYGIYRDVERDNLQLPPPAVRPPAVKHREYCTTSYSLQDGVQIISATDRYRRYAELRRYLVDMGIVL